MFDTPSELLDKIRLGEDSTLELKAVRFSGDRITGPEARDLADELAAFGNFVSGVVVLGVDDKTRSIDGIPEERLDLVETTIRDVVNDRIAPPLPVRIERLELPDLEGTLRAVVRIDVPRSLFVHRSPGGYLYRLGSSKRQMTPEMLARLFQQRSQTRMIRFDEQPVPDALPESIEVDLWRRFAPEIADDETIILRKLRLLVDTDGGEADERLSVAAVLMCTSEPHRWLSSARIEAVHYRGLERDSNYQRDARTITGPLDHQVTKAHEWVLSRMSTGAAKDPGRAELPQFASRAIFEALVNAVAHRDYAMYGSAIRLFMFDDRLELYSPGALPNTMDIDSMALRQFTRNELVASLLAKVQVDPATGVPRQAFMEKRGEGVPLILRATLALAGAPASYSVIDETELLLTLPAASIDPHDS